MPSRKRFYGRERSKQKFGKNGKALCRFCEKEVKRPRRTFCSDECVHQWKLRKSSSYLRAQVFKRDKGICYKCGIDTVVLRKAGFKMTYEEYRAYAKRLGFPYKRKTWWEAHHLQAVAEYGGLCGIENIATVCYPCHREETNKLLKRLSLKRKMEKSRKIILLPPSSIF